MVRLLPRLPCGQSINRRQTTDEKSLLLRRFVIQVEPTLESLEKQEDSDGNAQITIEDNGPKVRDKTSMIDDEVR